ncbi:MAG: C39 family peptidase [Peptococcaceae bacterium]|nr:C39 family peptidase [Peptococcaceae bacterium]
MYNCNLFVSQYCAAKDKDYESINLSDMENVLRGGVNQLYSYTSRTEIHEWTETDPETEEETTVTEKWIIYTIVYNGEAYFADRIFHLSGEQKELSQNYAQNMSIFMGDGMYQYLTSSEYVVGPSYEGIAFTDGQTRVTYYNQLDSRWANIMYGASSTIGQAGCGPASMAIVVSTLTGQARDPVELANWSVANGHCCDGNGSYHSLIPESAKAYGLSVAGAGANEAQRIADALADRKLVVAIMTKGHFTQNGHFIVLRGVTSDGKVLVADPASYTRSEKQWELSQILNEASKNAGAGGPFWIIG